MDKPEYFRRIFGIKLNNNFQKRDIEGLRVESKTIKITLKQDSKIKVFKFSDTTEIWLNEADYYAILDRLDEFEYAKYYQFGFINGTQAPFYNTRSGTMSANAYDGYQIWSYVWY